MDVPRSTFPTFVTFLTSFVFCVHRYGIVWDVNSQTYEKSHAKKKYTMGFLNGTTITYDIIEGQHHFFLDQAIDLNT